jgi:hypothetical protein
MNVDERLEQASQELREATRHLQPPPLRRGHSPARGWLVFAGVFLVVAIGLGVVPVLLRSQGDQAPLGTSETTPTTVTAATSQPAPSTTLGQCSAAGMQVPGAQDGLPSEVADMRTAIIDAAISCDMTALHAIAGDLLTSFGGGDYSSLQEWEAAGEGSLRVLVQLLGTRNAVQEIEGQPDIYVWPAAFVYDTWEEIPTEDLDELTAIFGQEEMELIAGFGSYAGWRVGITEDGDWRFFVAGD